MLGRSIKCVLGRGGDTELQPEGQVRQVKSCLLWFGFSFKWWTSPEQ